MANQYEHLLTAIDVGSAKTCALVAEITDNGLRYRGHGVAESRGTRKGVIVDLEKAVGSIQKAVEQAEDNLGAPVSALCWSFRSPHPRAEQPWRNHFRHASPRNQPAKKFARQWIKLARFRYPRIAKFCICSPGIHPRRTGWGSRSARHDGDAPGSSRPHRHRRRERDAERCHRSEQSRRSCGRHRF